MFYDRPSILYSPGQPFHGSADFTNCLKDIESHMCWLYSDVSCVVCQWPSNQCDNDANYYPACNQWNWFPTLRLQAFLEQPYSISQEICTRFFLLCFVVVIHWLIFPYPSGLLHWHCGNLTIAPVPAKQPWWIWINTSCEFIMNDCITTTKQSRTKPCAYFLGYTVYRQLLECHNLRSQNTYAVFLRLAVLPMDYAGIDWRWLHRQKTMPFPVSWRASGLLRPGSGLG